MLFCDTDILMLLSLHVYSSCSLRHVFAIASASAILSSLDKCAAIESVDKSVPYRSNARTILLMVGNEQQWVLSGGFFFRCTFVDKSLFTRT